MHATVTYGGSLFRDSRSAEPPLPGEAPRENTRRGFLRSAAVTGAASALSAGLTVGAPTAQAATVADLTLPPAGPDITPLRLRVPQSALDDLRRRLAAARLPEAETVEDGSQGAQLGRLGTLVQH